MSFKSNGQVHWPLIGAPGRNRQVGDVGNAFCIFYDVVYYVQRIIIRSLCIYIMFNIFNKNVLTWYFGCSRNSMSYSATIW